MEWRSGRTAALSGVVVAMILASATLTMSSPGRVGASTDAKRIYLAGRTDDRSRAKVGFVVHGEKVRSILFVSGKGTIPCRSKDGSRARPSGLFSAFGRTDLKRDGTFGVHEEWGRKRQGLPASVRDIEGAVEGSMATGTLRHSFIYRGFRHHELGQPRYCDTGRLQWEATPMSRAEWRRYFGQPLHNERTIGWRSS